MHSRWGAGEGGQGEGEGGAGPWPGNPIRQGGDKKKEGKKKILSRGGSQRRKREEKLGKVPTQEMSSSIHPTPQFQTQRLYPEYRK